MDRTPDQYRCHRFPGQITGHAVWLYHTFSLSFRNVELLLAERGVILSHESVGPWCLKFGGDFAARLRRRRPRPGDTWHLDEVFLRVNGMLHYLWRAVDQHGVVLDILVQDRRNATAAKRFFRRLLAGLKFKPRRIVTDGLRSYHAARGHARGATPDDPLLEQSGGELAQADPAPRASDAAVPLGARHDLWSLPSASASDDRRPVSPRARHGLPDLAAGNVFPRGSVMPSKLRHMIELAWSPNNVTIPSLSLRRWSCAVAQLAGCH